MMDCSMNSMELPSNLNILRGTLKQQCLDTQGLYVWEKKTFYLDIPNKTLTVTSVSSHHNQHNEATASTESPTNNNLQTSISLRGAKYAKEWSFSSTLTGFGFDLVWSSGKIWSFLVDDQDTCKKWVDFLNISLSLDDDDNPWKMLVSNSPDHMDKPPKPPVIHESNNNKNTSSQEVKSESVDKVKQGKLIQRADSVGIPSTVDSMRSVPTQGSSTTAQSRSSIHRSTISMDPNITTAMPPSNRYSQIIHNDDDADSIGSLVNSNRTDISFRDSPVLKAHHNNNNLTSSPINDARRIASNDSKTDSFGNSPIVHSNDGQLRNTNKSILSSQRPGNEDTIVTGHRDRKTTISPLATSPPPIHSIEQRLLTSRHQGIDQQQRAFDGSYDPLTEERFHELSVLLRQKETALELLTRRHDQLQARHEEIVGELEKRLDIAKDKEMQLIRESKRELDNKLLRASNENMSYHEAAMKAMRLQHDRELSCVRDELVEERRRHTDLITRAQSLRERAESSDLETQREVVALRDKLSAMSIDLAQMRKSHETDKQAWDRDKRRITVEYESTIQQMKEESERVVAQSREEVRQKVLEMNEKMKTSINNIKNSDLDIVRQELEGQRLRSIAELQKQCQKEVEMVRTEERKLASIEMANLRQAFLSREHQTSEDVIQLEKLHSLRVTQLEHQLTNLKVQCKSTEEKLSQANRQLQTNSMEASKSVLDAKAAMEAQEKRSTALHQELQRAHTEIQELRSREVSYRDQLSKALTQSRVQHAELLEAKRQASSGNAQAFQWKHAIKESELSINAAETTVQIAKDEISMLEHELKRMQAENYELKAELNRADKLIYGVPQFKQPLHSQSTADFTPQSKAKGSTAGPFGLHHMVSPDLSTPTARYNAMAQIASSGAGSSRMKLKRSSVLKK